MNANKGIAIAVIGPGLVGQQVLYQLSNLPDSTVALYGKFMVKAIANSKSMFLILDDTFDSLKDQNETRSFLNDKGEPVNLNKLCSFLLETNSAASVIIDCSSSEVLAQQYPHWLSLGINIVTPNKKALSSKFELFQQIKMETMKRKVFCYHESTVGAGLPVLDILKNMVDSGDQVLKIEGILSGTISYIFNSFATNDKTFSQIVHEAKKLGYTEPDPRDDLNGMDIARKTLILARMCGFKIEINDIKVDKILPQGYIFQQDSINVEDFMSELVKCDQYFAMMKENAKKQSKVLKFVSTVDVIGKKFSVCLKE